MLEQLRKRWISPPGVRAQGGRRLVILALLVWTVAGQIGAIVHRVNHESSPHAAACILCLAADHLAAPISDHTADFTPLKPVFVTVATATVTTLALARAYQSRAPPRS
jgi:hypothetical protein